MAASSSVCLLWPWGEGVTLASRFERSFVFAFNMVQSVRDIVLLLLFKTAV